MPRSPLTPAQARAQADFHAACAADAAGRVASLLSNASSDPAARKATMRECAKVLEAAGCYIRRQADRDLL